MLSALTFLTVLGRSAPPDRRTFRWFPVVGAGLGAAVGGVHLGVHRLWPPLVAGVVVVAADLILTGALHLDGLADSADGLLVHADRPRRLALMAEPGIGVFALAAGGIVLLARWALLTDPDIELLSLVALWAVSRTLAASVPAFVRYARRGGLAEPFLSGSRHWLLAWLAPAGAGLFLLEGARGPIALGVAVATGALIAAVAHRRLGGFTGDVLGAVIMLSETAALLTLVASP
ncbi:MAG: adenosylcobinamide-GDP ribazoletransferase [Acidimicrobiia bacterium]|nr:adenosylcobinamide-GDP ribazoletransferase [Acidimicrobiia bacterium]MYC44944.1 adenosylcobinamide-GDP ribazoletransferase [Acidimicrobiia bacterium]MYI19156.1 adenosylcobinamide-GDP ribazoletransferase [Acidimicrobiia bacterium]